MDRIAQIAMALDVPDPGAQPLGAAINEAKARTFEVIAESQALIEQSKKLLAE